MCHVIESDNFLANLFNTCHVKRISINRLKQFRIIVENKLPNVYIDITPHSLERAVELFPNMFQWEGKFLIKKEGNADFFTDANLQSKFNWRLPEQISERYIETIKKYCKR